MINLQECFGIIAQKTIEHFDTFGLSMVEQCLRGQDVRSMNDADFLCKRLFGRTNSIRIKDEQAAAEHRPKKAPRRHQRRNRRKKPTSVGQKVSQSLHVTAHQEDTQSSNPLSEGKEATVVSSCTTGHQELIPLCRYAGRHEFCADTEQLHAITCRFCGQKKTCEPIHKLSVDYLLARRKRRFMDHLPYDLSLPLSPHTHIDILSLLVAAGVVAREDNVPCVTLVEGLPESDPCMMNSVYDSLLMDSRGFVMDVTTLPTEFPMLHIVALKVQLPAWDAWSRTRGPDFPTVLPQWPSLRISLGLVAPDSIAVRMLADYFTQNPIIYTSPETMLFTSPDFPKTT